MTFLRWGGCLLVVLILAGFFLGTWNKTMTSNASYFRLVRKHIDGGDNEKALTAMADWCKDHPKAPQCSSYAACVADLAERLNNPKWLAMGQRMTVTNVLAGR